MSDEVVREFLRRDEATGRGMLLVNPFTLLSGGSALLVGLLVVAATVLLAAHGGVRFDGIADLHVGTGAPVQMWRTPGVEAHAEPPYTGPLFPVWAVAALPVMDWLVVAVLFWVAGAVFGSGPRRLVDYFAMSAVGRLPFALAGLMWTDGLLGHFLGALGNLQASQVISYLQQTGAFPWIIAGGLLTMLIMAWGLFLNFFALRESSGMKTGKAIGVYVGVIVVGEIISKVLAMAPLWLPTFLRGA